MVPKEIDLSDIDSTATEAVFIPPRFEKVPPGEQTELPDDKLRESAEMTERFRLGRFATEREDDGTTVVRGDS